MARASSTQESPLWNDHECHTLKFMASCLAITVCGEANCSHIILVCYLAIQLVQPLMQPISSLDSINAVISMIKSDFMMQHASCV